MRNPRNDLIAEIATLRNRVEELEAELVFMRERAAIPDSAYLMARALGIPHWLVPVMHLFMARQIVSSHALVAIGDEMEWSTSWQFPRVAVYRLRQYLGPHDIHFETLWGVGYKITPDDQARLNALVH